MSIILTEEQQKEELAGRVKRFKEGLDALQAETKIALTTTVSLVDMKHEDSTPQQ